MSIIDRRHSSKNSSFPNREKFLRRYKSVVKDKLKEIVARSSIKDFKFKKNKVSINTKDLDTPVIEYDSRSGKSTRVLPGNRHFLRGNRIRKEGLDDHLNKGGGADGPSQDEFEFLLTEKEFANLFFDGLELPNLLKKILSSTTTELRRAGYCKYGSPSALNIKKSMANAIGRRKVLSKLKSKVNYLEESDLRYNYKTKQEVPDSNAVMFCMLDVSGSMGEQQKDFAKRFYILLNLFLKRHYDNVDVVFVRHAETAEEVDEKEFFHGIRSGGTIMSSGYEVINNLIKSKYNPASYNIYIAQASDGDNWVNDNPNMIYLLTKALLPVVQYMFYIYTPIQSEYISTWDDNYVLALLKKIKKQVSNFAVGTVEKYEDVYPVFREFFSKKGVK